MILLTAGFIVVVVLVVVLTRLHGPVVVTPAEHVGHPAAAPDEGRDEMSVSGADDAQPDNDIEQESP
jgi:hypothetical protein